MNKGFYLFVQELEKRANPRLSKIERLRKEILEARDAEGDAADSVVGGILCYGIQSFPA